MTMRSLILRLRSDQRGLAFLEFAFAAPILLFMILAGLELANYALAHLRVNQIAMTVADNAGRVITGIDEANVYEVFAGAGVVGDRMDFMQNGRIVLSSLEHNGLSGSDAGQTIGWQRCWGDLDVAPAYGNEGSGKDSAELANGLGSGTTRIVATPGTAVMVAEVTYDYQPLVGGSFLDLSTRIRHESAFNVRGRQNNAISNTQDLEILDCPEAEPIGVGAGGGTSTSTSGGTTSTSTGGTGTSSTSSSTTSTSSSSGGSGGGGGSSGGSSGGGSSGGLGGLICLIFPQLC